MALWYNVCRVCMLLFCILGIVISSYAYYVEISKEKNSNFQAACDIADKISCSKVLTSKYGRGFGLVEYIVGPRHWLNQPNSVFGLAFYTLMAFLAFQNTGDSAVIQLVFTSVANLFSVYLAAVLYFILEDFCVLCVTTYVINFLLLLCSVAKLSHVARRQMAIATKQKSTKKTQ